MKETLEEFFERIDKERYNAPMLTHLPQFGVFHSTSLVYKYMALYDEMCEWWETTQRIQAINRKKKVPIEWESKNT